MTAPQNPRVTDADYDLLRLLDVPATADHLLMAAHHREAAEAKAKAREAALVEALKGVLKEVWDDWHSNMTREQFEQHFAEAFAALTKEPGA